MSADDATACTYAARLDREHGVPEPLAQRLDHQAGELIARARRGEITRDEALVLAYDQAVAAGAEMGLCAPGDVA